MWRNWCATLQPAAPNLQLDFAAHSMGNRILLQMLREFGQARENLPIGAAIFAAPDIAQDVFKEQIRLGTRSRPFARFTPRNMIAPS